MGGRGRMYLYQLLNDYDSLQYRKLDPKLNKKDIDRKGLYLNDFGSLSNSHLNLINKIYRYFNNNDDKAYKKLVNRGITPSGGLEKNGVYYGSPYIWIKPISRGNIDETIVSVELYLMYADRLYGFQCGKPRKDLTNTGTLNYRRFLHACKDCGVDIDSYKLPDLKTAQEVKASIKSPYIYTIDNFYPEYLYFGYIDKVNHIDIHEAYRAGLYEHHPELEPVFNKIDEKYKEHGVNKDITNMSLGMFQSKYIGYRLANLSKEAIEWTRDKVQAIASQIKKAGGLILGFNTDGLFYRMLDGSIYHGEGEGDKVGQWHNDYTEMDWLPLGSNWVCLSGYDKHGHKGFYKAMRGQYKYSDVKPYEAWDCWQDILKALATQEYKVVSFDDKKGWKVDIIKNELIKADRNSTKPINITKKVLQERRSL